MAKCYTGNHDIISLRNGYHGMTCQVMGLTSISHYKYPIPQQPGAYSVSIFLYLEIQKILQTCCTKMPVRMNQDGGVFNGIMNEFVRY